MLVGGLGNPPIWEKMNLRTPFMGIHPKELNAEVKRHIHTPLSLTVLFKIARSWKQAKCPSTDELTKKMCWIHTVEYHSPLKRKEF